MFVQVSLALFLGVLAGTFTGLFPGIHVNLLASALLASLGLFSSIPLIALSVFIVSMSIAHTFLNFIPSIFLGAPEEDSFLSILPGHRMLQEGQGHKAFIITLYGSLTALIIMVLFSPLYILFLPQIFDMAKTAIPFILIFISLYLIFREENFILSIVVFLLAGFLGFLTFNLPIKEPLMPLLSGLFGISSMLISLKTKSKIPKQQIEPFTFTNLSKKDFIKALTALLISSPLCAFLPGIGSSHAATIGSEIIPQNTKGFLFLIGATNTLIMGLSFVTLYAINKSRSGSAAAISEILNIITLHDLIILLAAIVLSRLLAALFSIKISKFFAEFIMRINYTYLTIGTILIVLLINLIFTNWLGILVLLISISLGIFAILSKSRRINLMGALIIPAIIYYLI